MGKNLPENELSNIEMDTVVLVPSAYAELLPPLAVFQACGLVLIFSVFVDVTQSPDPSGVTPTQTSLPCAAGCRGALGRLLEKGYSLPWN